MLPTPSSLVSPWMAPREQSPPELPTRPDSPPQFFFFPPSRLCPSTGEMSPPPQSTSSRWTSIFPSCFSLKIYLLRKGSLLQYGPHSQTESRPPHNRLLKCCFIGHTAWYTVDNQYICSKKSTITVLGRLFLSRGYNTSTKRLILDWDGGRCGGEEPRWLGTEQVATFQGTLDRAWDATDRARNWRATESERGAQAGPHALKAPSPSLFIFQGREFATLETLPEAWYPGNCLVMGQPWLL